MAKTNHQLRKALSQLKDWAEIERRIAEHPEALKAWREVAEWAESTDAIHNITLSRTFSPTPPMGRMAETARPGSV